jgi:hypothetical protein
MNAWCAAMCRATLIRARAAAPLLPPRALIPWENTRAGDEESTATEVVGQGWAGV